MPGKTWVGKWLLSKPVEGFRPSGRISPAANLVGGNPRHPARHSIYSCSVEPVGFEPTTVSLTVITIDQRPETRTPSARQRAATDLLCQFSYGPKKPGQILKWALFLVGNPFLRPGKLPQGRPAGHDPAALLRVAHDELLCPLSYDLHPAYQDAPISCICQRDEWKTGTTIPLAWYGERSPLIKHEPSVRSPKNLALRPGFEPGLPCQLGHRRSKGHLLQSKAHLGSKRPEAQRHPGLFGRPVSLFLIASPAGVDQVLPGIEAAL